MTDKISKKQRSANMRAVRGKDTGPELFVRRTTHALGYRFRLHRTDLPGTPDLTFPSRSKVIFVHGCFWHQHKKCKRATVPQSNRGFWQPKLARNVQRDTQNLNALKAAGWKVLVIWECETKDRERMTIRLKHFLD